MIWYTITDAETDQTPHGKGSDLLVGTAAQVTDNLKRLKEAGLNLLLNWPPFADVPVSKTLDDLERVKEEICRRSKPGLTPQRHRCVNPQLVQSSSPAFRLIAGRA